MNMMKTTAKQQAMSDLFNATAHAQYMSSTRKSFDELLEYLEQLKNSWSEVMTAEDFCSIDNCIKSARNVATAVVERENFRRFFDNMDTK